MRSAPPLVAVVLALLLSGCITGALGPTPAHYTVTFGTITGSPGAYRVADTTTIPFPCGNPGILHGPQIIPSSSGTYTSYIRLIPPSNLTVRDGILSRDEDGGFSTNGLSGRGVVTYLIICEDGKVLGAFSADEFFGSFRVEVYINGILYDSIAYEVLPPNLS